MGVAAMVLYSVFAFVAALNLALMRRPRPQLEGDDFCILIPARNESNNLQELIPLLQSQLGGPPKIYVFDDESEDGTGQVAADLGALVVRPREPLPKGWTGKNRACHELAKVAAEDSDAKWYLFLDADVRPAPHFLAAMRGLAVQSGRAVVLTGFPQMLPGKGMEPLFLAWVGWILLSTNPYGLVSRTGRSHSRFTNGQVHAWRSDVYVDLWPNERVKGHVMEDVMMGRILAHEKLKVEVANLSHCVKVRMYDSWRETLDGMSKNSFEITGSVIGSLLLALFLAAIGLLWLGAGSLIWAGLGTLILSGILVAITVRGPIWPAFLMPLALLIGAWTILRSAYWRKTGQTRWKGRIYAD
ncbi:MAG: glycosyltransferase [Fimbriimonadaceae bacterium]|nr:glycosyltransferase [Fimbriimonadaceae bacterium]